MRMADSVLFTCWTAGAGSPVGIDTEIGGIDGHFHFVGFRENGHRGRGRVYAPLGFGVRHALNPVNAAFKFEPGVGPETLNTEHDFLEPPEARRRRGIRFHRKSLFHGIARIHAKEVAGENGRLVAPGPRANFDDHVPRVPRIPGDQEIFQFLRHPLHLTPKHAELFLGQGRRSGSDDASRPSAC
jgi:hypothetical protein